MAFAAGAAIVVGGSLLSADSQKSAANSAADAQVQAAQLGVDEQRRQFDTLRDLLAPYVSAGNNSLGAQSNLLGLNGNNAQQAAISNLQNGAQYQSLLKSGNDSILANASATGGLRGGNVQTALGKYAPTLLSGVIQQQLGNLGTVSQMGQNAAAGTGAAGLQTGNNVANLLAQQGQAQAGAALASGKADQQLYGSLTKIGGSLLGGGGF